jgi:hypothetical protein
VLTLVVALCAGSNRAAEADGLLFGALTGVAFFSIAVILPNAPLLRFLAASTTLKKSFIEFGCAMVPIVMPMDSS